MQTQEKQMSYYSSPGEAKAHAADFMSSPRQVFVDTSHPAQSEKWPLWWTALGLAVFCGLFWTALFRLIF